MCTNQLLRNTEITCDEPQVDQSDDRDAAPALETQSGHGEAPSPSDSISDPISAFAAHFRQVQVAESQRSFEIGKRIFDEVSLMWQPYEGDVQFYRVYGTELAEHFLNSLPGLGAGDFEEEVNRTWFEFLSRRDQGAVFALSDAALPEWLQGKLELLRGALGEQYSVDLVAHRSPHTSASALTVDVRIQRKGVDSEVTQTSLASHPDGKKNDKYAMMTAPSTQASIATAKQAPARRLGLRPDASPEAIGVELRLQKRVASILKQIPQAIEEARNDPAVLDKDGIVCMYGLNLGKVKTALACPAGEPKWYHSVLRKSAFYVVAPFFDPYRRAWFTSPAFDELLEGIKRAGGEPVLRLTRCGEPEIKKPADIFKYLFLDPDDEVELKVAVRLPSRSLSRSISF
jgi:hypothetical protein